MDPNGDKVDGKALPWTEEAKFQFLIRIVAQLRENGRSINWQKIDMPGRTVKSMQNMWTKINKMIAEVEAESGDAPIKRPSRGFPPYFFSSFLVSSVRFSLGFRLLLVLHLFEELNGAEALSCVAGLPWRIGNLMTDKPAARKRTPRKGQSVAASEDDDERSTPAKSPRKGLPQKRASTGRGGTAKKLKKGADDIDDEDDMVFKPEPEVDDALELSDDSDIDIEVHPSVDKRSCIRAKQNRIHIKRRQRKLQIKDLKYENAVNNKLLRRVFDLLQSLEAAGPGAHSRNPVEIAFEMNMALAMCNPEDVVESEQPLPAYSKMIAGLLDKTNKTLDERGTLAAERFDSLEI
ncbi:Hsp90 co-chaperone [Metarhizium brunneum]|uniref:Hsp90 co-chaperone n=1 Tax=Metarhizium brunneum TaxID=500148 RepID=A0A7D5Z235_9HYPO|nr:Hsp90 co-chaperone [Metarhizium brunneum]